MDVPSITRDEVKKALQRMYRDKEVGKDEITVILIKNGGDTKLKKLVTIGTGRRMSLDR